MKIIENIKDAKTSELVAFWNANNVSKIKKFVDRKTAEKRCAKLRDTLADLEKLRAKMPAIEVITDAADKKALKAIEMEGAPKAPKSATPATGAAKKQNTPPHLNLRCPSCGYYAKTTPACLKIARLACPVDPKHGKLLTAEERNEKRGR